MDTYIKKVVVLTNEERDILRKAANIMVRLYQEIDNYEFDQAETILITAHTTDAFSVEIHE